MANQDKKKQKDEFRIIEENTASDEEVVRLDSPKRLKPGEKMKLTAGGVVSGAASRPEEEEVVIIEDFDPEKEWLEQKEGDDKRSVPMGWFVLLGIVLLGVFGWVIIQSVSSSRAEDSNEASLKPDEDGPLGKEAELMAKDEAEAHFKETEEVVRNFLAAETIDEMVKFVRHPARVRPLMEAFYQKQELEPSEYTKIKEYRIVPLDNHPFIALSVKLSNADEDEDEVAILVEDCDDGQRVDWESFVCYQEIYPDEYVANRRSEAVLLRAYVSPDHFYSYEFDDEEKYMSYRLQFRHSELSMNAYVERGTELERKFLKVISSWDFNTKRPLILKVRFLEGGRAPKSVLVEELVSQKWAFAENPDKVASKEESQ